MPEDWAASGAKLGFNLEVEFCDDPCADYEMTKERLLQGTAVATKNNVLRSTSSSLKACEPLNEPTFVSTSGTQTIKVTEGAYAGDSDDENDLITSELDCSVEASRQSSRFAN